MNVYEKLQHVQSGLKAPKNQYNKFGNYYYRNCEDIQEAAKPLLQEVKAALVVGDELVMIGDRYYIRATARFVDCEYGLCEGGTGKEGNGCVTGDREHQQLCQEICPEWSVLH